jgi:hypothetical protein
MLLGKQSKRRVRLPCTCMQHQAGTTDSNINKKRNSRTNTHLAHSHGPPSHTLHHSWLNPPCNSITLCDNNTDSTKARCLHTNTHPWRTNSSS